MPPSAEKPPLRTCGTRGERDGPDDLPAEDGGSSAMLLRPNSLSFSAHADAIDRTTAIHRRARAHADTGRTDPGCRDRDRGGRRNNHCRCRPHHAAPWVCRPSCNRPPPAPGSCPTKPSPHLPAPKSSARRSALPLFSTSCSPASRSAARCNHRVSQPTCSLNDKRRRADICHENGGTAAGRAGRCHEHGMDLRPGLARWSGPLDPRRDQRHSQGGVL
ncbi:hypothetical protein ACVWWO_005703 [Bradyrhizobium sp. F1.13.1]